MDRTPKNSRPSGSSSSKHNISTANEIQCTPIFDKKMFSEIDNDDSPVHIASTQEGCENVDVIWDWNSPQAKPRRSKKRLILSQSPKVLKRHPSNNNIQNFEKLREELQALREALALPDNEESLVLSPVEEAEYKTVDINDHNINDAPPSTQEIYLGGNDDFFNDSADEDLLLCTQKIEADLESMKKNIAGSNNNLINTLKSKDTNVNRNTDIVNVNVQLANNFQSQTEDSINMTRKTNVQERLNPNDVINNSVINNNQVRKNSANSSFTRTKSENRFKYSKQIGKVEFHRTQSFESTVEYTKEVIPRHKLEEIEKKRKEALAKLESKRKQQEYNLTSKCSPEEIEQKRLQAIAKLEAKRLQEHIERKRLEALKRRELSRKKNAVVVKSSLSERL